MSRRATGEGTIYRRKDGRWEGAAYVPTTAGTIRRLRVYGKTRIEASTKLTARLAAIQQGVLAPERSWTVRTYADHFMHDIAPTTLRPSTIALYERIVDRHIGPLFGPQLLRDLTVIRLQRTFDDQRAHGMSGSTAIHIKTVLMAMLTQAMREDLLARNVARLVRLPTVERKPFTPWTINEIRQFVTSIESEPLYPAYLLAALYGMRRGEVLGLKWVDIDWDNDVLQIRQQLVQVHGALHIGPLKTRKSRRDLPLLPPVRAALLAHRTRADNQRTDLDLIFCDRAGEPIPPKHFAQTLFHRLSRRAGLRPSRLHGFRHSAATTLGSLGVPDKDIQAILGHARVSTTRNVYQHADIRAEKTGLDQFERLLRRGDDRPGSRQLQPSNRKSSGKNRAILSDGTAPRGAKLQIVVCLSHLTADPQLTPVFRQLRARTILHVLAVVAVNSAVTHDPDQLLAVHWDELRQALNPRQGTWLHIGAATNAQNRPAA